MKTSRLIGFIVGCAVLVSCGATTYDKTAESTVSPINVSTSTLPTGSVEELLPRLVDAMTLLSSFIGPNQSGRTKSGKAEQLGLINGLWNAIETDLVNDDPVVAESLGRMIDLSNVAITSNRPADADKAAKFAGQVVDNYLNR